MKLEGKKTGRSSYFSSLGGVSPQQCCFTDTETWCGHKAFTPNKAPHRVADYPTFSALIRIREATQVPVTKSHGFLFLFYFTEFCSKLKRERGRACCNIFQIPTKHLEMRAILWSEDTGRPARGQRVPVTSQVSAQETLGPNSPPAGSGPRRGLSHSHLLSVDAVGKGNAEGVKTSRNQRPDTPRLSLGGRYNRQACAPAPPGTHVTRAEHRHAPGFSPSRKKISSLSLNCKSYACP